MRTHEQITEGSLRAHLRIKGARERGSEEQGSRGSRSRILYLTGGEQRPVENLQQQPLATMRDEVTSCQ